MRKAFAHANSYEEFHPYLVAANSCLKGRKQRKSKDIYFLGQSSMAFNPAPTLKQDGMMFSQFPKVLQLKVEIKTTTKKKKKKQKKKKQKHNYCLSEKLTPLV